MEGMYPGLSLSPPRLRGIWPHSPFLFDSVDWGPTVGGLVGGTVWGVVDINQIITQMRVLWRRGPGSWEVDPWGPVLGCEDRGSLLGRGHVGSTKELIWDP